MSDDRTRTGGQGRARIGLAEDHEVRDWAVRLGVSEKAVRDAVAHVGDRAEDVQRGLRGER